MSDQQIGNDTPGALRTFRAHWTSRIGFILAATGSAIGLGNIWKFPYMTGVHGGGAFVIIYLASVIVVGLPLMFSELIIGRRAQCNPVGAFQQLHRKGSPWQVVGWSGVAAGFMILAFYSVVAGWGLAYILKSIIGFSGTRETISAEFGELVSSPELSILWHTIFMGFTIAIVASGIKDGIERWSKILMPALLVILAGLMVYGLFFTPGGSEAVSFLFKPDFSALSAEGVLSALGHAFFTLSLGMGAMITYGSYMEKGARVVRDAVTISVLDTVVALCAGLAIFSIVFSFNMQPGQGPGLIFQTLAPLFQETGRLVSIPFFVLLAFAALSSAISLLEVVASYFIDMRGWRRVPTVLLMGGLIYLMGILCAVPTLKVPFSGGLGWFDVLEKLTTNYMLPLGGLFTCFFIAWVVKDAIRREEYGSGGTSYRLLILTLKFVTPIAVVLVLLHGLNLLPIGE
jgi:NSS family neurotransmitter:Na+ symporter